jgi:hypothetical protein
MLAALVTANAFTGVSSVAGGEGEHHHTYEISADKIHFDTGWPVLHEFLSAWRAAKHRYTADHGRDDAADGGSAEGG